MDELPPTVDAEGVAPFASSGKAGSVVSGRPGAEPGRGQTPGTRRQKVSE